MADADGRACNLPHMYMYMCTEAASPRTSAGLGTGSEVVGDIRFGRWHTFQRASPIDDAVSLGSHIALGKREGAGGSKHAPKALPAATAMTAAADVVAVVPEMAEAAGAALLVI